ncbi:MAG: polysaccharide deacetylase family protein [Candidatus Eremiobacteraeota bacterium]|nr:polysaccharide deacetylase family protein [Candidatus Eremiobacteraeota bacterium]
MITNYYAIDVESWAHSSRPKLAALSSAERKRLDGGATAWQVGCLLRVLKQLETRLTFFITGEIFDWHPDLIEHIANDGHEIAFHTQRHQVLKTKQDLENEISAANRFLSVWRPHGFRAPAMEMLTEAYHLLRESGFLYSSSVYASCTSIPVDGIVEIPVSTQRRSRNNQGATKIPARMTLRLWTEEIPYGSGYVLGLCGWRYVHKLILAREAHGMPSNLFVHNWQLFAYDRRSLSHQYIEALRNPLHLPYTRIIARDFIGLARRHHFSRLDAHPAVSGAKQKFELSGVVPEKHHVLKHLLGRNIAP